MKRYIITIILALALFTTNAQDATPPSGLQSFGGGLYLRQSDSSVYAHFRNALGVFKFLRLPRYREFKPLTATNSTLTFSGVYNGFEPQNIGLNLSSSNNWLAKQTITLNSSQLRLAYDSNNYADFSVSSIGNVTITPVGTGGPLTTRSVSFNGYNFTCGNEESNIEVPSSQSTDFTNNPLYSLGGGASFTSYRTAFGGAINSIIGTSINYATVIFKKTLVTKNPTAGTHNIFANVAINPLVITNGLSTLTNSASLYVNGAATNALNNYAIYSIGLNRMDTIKTNRLLLNGAYGTPSQLPRVNAGGLTMEWFTPMGTELQTYMRKYSASGNGVATTITIIHGLPGISSESMVWITPTNSSGSGYSHVTIDATFVNITYNTPPASGTNNLSFDIQIKP